MREITTAEVRPDASKSACFRACATLTGCYDCQPRTLLAIYPCQGTPEGAILASNHREFEECRINGRLSEAEAVIRLD